MDQAPSPPSERRVSPRKGLKSGTFVFFGATLFIISLFGFLFLSSYETSRHGALVTANNLSGILAVNIETALNRAQSDIRVFVPQITAEDLAGHASKVRKDDLEARLGYHLRYFPTVRHYHIFNAEGGFVFGTGKITPQVGLNVADRTWFQNLRDNPDRDFIISQVLLSKLTNEQTLIMAVPIRDHAHHFQGAISAVINLSYFQNLIDNLDVGPKGLIAIRRTDDFHLALRHPHADDQINKSVQTNGFTAPIISHNGEGDFISSVDQVERRYSVHTLDNYPLTILVAVAAEDYLLPWRQQTAITSVIALMLIGTLMTLFRRQQLARIRLSDAAMALRKSEAQLASEASRFRHLLQTASDGIHILDHQGNLVLASDSFYRMLGYKEGCAPKLHVTNWDVQWTAADFHTIIPRQITTPETFCTKHRRQDGSIFDVEIHSRGIELDGLEYLFASSRDITERKQAEGTLRDQGYLLSESQRITHVGSWRYELTGELSWSDETYRIYRVSPETFTPNLGSLISLIHSDDRQEFQAWIRACAEGKKPGSLEFRIFAPDGAVRILNGYGELQFDVENRPSHLVGIVHDITEQRKYEEDLRQSNEDLERFAYVASHDLREPLRMVTNYLALLERRLGKDLDKDCHDFIGFAIDGAKRMNQLILDLLEYSRIGHTGGESERQNLSVMAEQAATDLHFVIEEAKGKIEIANLPKIWGNNSELTRLFQNLIGNALKYRSPDRPPMIRISAAQDGPNWIVSVSDNGIGIEPEYFEKIFGVFQRLHGRGEYDGTGIGLANCKKIVEHHGGRIWVESQPGEGSTFLFTLPKIQDDLSNPPPRNKGLEHVAILCDHNML